MHYIAAEEIGKLLEWSELIQALRQMFVEGCEAPVRHHHSMALPDQEDATMLLMPAWLTGKYCGLKVVNVYPDNNKKELPTIMGSYLLMDGATGAPLVSMDAGELTARRTAAASALASTYLSRKDSRKLLIVGSGKLAGYLGFAHAAVRQIDEIRIWARNPAKAKKIAKQYREAGFMATAVDELEHAAKWADIISCATMSTKPLIQGKWLAQGTHLDLIGSFKPVMRETDDEVMRIAQIFADTTAGVLAEAGDILIPLQNGVISPGDIIAELSELCSGQHEGRHSEQQITVFKSVGAALEDLSAAIICYENWKITT